MARPRPRDACIMKQSSREFHWKRWLLIALLVLICAIVAAIIGFTTYAHARLQNLIDAYRAAGEPVLPADFVLPHIPDESNAATFLRQAAMKIPTEHLQVLRELPDHLPFSPQQQQVLRNLLETDRQALADLRAARQFTDVNWQVPIQAMFDLQRIPEFDGMRLSGLLLHRAALLEHQTGNDERAVALLQDLIAAGDAAYGLLPGAVSYLVAQSLTVSGTRGVAEMAHDLKIGSQAGFAAPQEVKALLTLLLDESAVVQGWRSGLNGDRALILHHGQSLADRFLLGSVIRFDIADAMSTCTIVRDAGLLPNMPAAKLALSTIKSVPPRPWRPMSLLLPTLHQLVPLHFRALAERRMAAVALAIRMYQVDHGGVLPANLHELVPAYLPDLPVDPFAPDGRTFGYIPTSPGPLIYSVAENFTDDQASTRPSRKSPYRHDPSLWDYEDAVLYLFRTPQGERAEQE